MKNRMLVCLVLTIVVLLIPVGVSAQEDIVKFQGDIEIRADQVVNGNVVTMSGDVKVRGTVNGDITTFKGNVYLEDSSKVTGNITVFAGQVFTSSQAIVQGDIVDFKNKNFQVMSQSPIPVHIQQPNSGVNIGSFIIQLLGLAALSLLGLSLFGKPLASMNLWLQDNLGSVLVKGFLGWLTFPFLLIALVITIIGIPIAFLGVILMPLPFVVGLWVVGLFTGEKLVPFLKTEWQDNLLIKGLLGVVVIWLAVKAPVLGFLVVPAVAVVGLGVILDSKFGTGRPWFKGKKGDI